jgi:hypothetical protein
MTDTPAGTAPLTTLADALTALNRANTTAQMDSTARARAASRAARSRTAPATRNSGVSIHYDGRTWLSAGAAIPFVEADFVRAADDAGSPVFRRSDRKDDVIYVPTTPGMVAPFRAVRER